jgi:hypothetical protein
VTDDWADAIMTVGARSVNPEIIIKVMAATLIALFASKFFVNLILHIYMQTF